MFCKDKLWEILVVETSDTVIDFLFVLLVRIHFDKNLIYSRTSTKNHIKIILTSSQFTECVQHQVLNQMQQQIYTFLLLYLLFSFT